MEFDDNLAAVHAYLCSDGYVTKNSEISLRKKTQYRIGFRNKNLELLQDFQKKFYNYFKIKPNLYVGERCALGSKIINEDLIKKFGSFYSYEWKMPIIDIEFKPIWLRAFFDCDGWVFCKSHQNRHVGVCSVNEKGIDQIKESLEDFGIKSIKKVSKRNLFSLFIYGKDNILTFRDKIGFLHPKKKAKLETTVNDFIDYNWNLKLETELIKKVMLLRAKIKKPYAIRVISKEKYNLDNLKKFLNKLFSVEEIKIYERVNGLGTKYFELNINKLEEVKKLLRHDLIDKNQVSKMELKNS